MGTTTGRNRWHRAAGRVLLACAVLMATVACQPKSVTPPSIVGVPGVGQVVRASVGTWSGAPTSFTYRWQSCDGAGEACLNQQSGERAAFVVTAPDAGQRGYQVVVTALNRDGQATATSGLTTVVTEPGVPAVAWAGAATSPDRSRTLQHPRPVDGAGHRRVAGRSW